jgi:hypothetical protein
MVASLCEETRYSGYFQTLSYKTFSHLFKRLAQLN